MKARIALVGIMLIGLVAACQPAPTNTGSTGEALKVLAVESFLADIAQNVAGQRAKVETLIPLGADPHEYEPTPQDIARIADSSVLIINGAGLETWLEKSLQNAGGNRAVVTASQGLKSRKTTDSGAAAGVDPHFWLDPNLAISYAENIRDGLIQADPAGAEIYRQNAASYIASLKDLDGWIRSQVETIPPERRLLVTNHESLGYYADRYGFRIIGAVIPSTNTDASPSARQVSDLITAIRQAKAPAVFMETGTNPQLAQQVARETGTKVVNDLYLETLTPKNGPAPDYLSMLRYDTNSIVEALR